MGKLYYILDMVNGVLSCLGFMDPEVAYAAYVSYIKDCGYDMSAFTTLTPLDDDEDSQQFTDVFVFGVYKFAFFSCSCVEVDLSYKGLDSLSYLPDSDLLPLCVSF